MKKSVVKNKKNRRLKKAVRRTIGALFMISAIIVAAIPTPEARAAGYAYPDEASAFSAEKATMEVKVPATDNIISGIAYTITKPSSGSWQLDWQFEYCAASAGANGWITKYNSQYSVDNIELDYRVYSDYITVSEADYSNFYNGITDTTNVNPKKGDVNLFASGKDVKSLGRVYILSGDPTACADKDFFQNHFATEYDTYKSQYDTWNYHKTYDPPESQPELNYPKPEEIKKTYKDVYTTDAERMQFFCDQVFGEGTQMTLQIVDKRIYSGGVASSWEKVYAPQLLTTLSGTDSISIGGQAYYADRNGFLNYTFAALVGIAPEAFKGVGNVKTLTMAKEISYIGDSAFEDSFLGSVTLSMGAKIGNRAFAKCSRLSSVTLPDGVTAIGCEAFHKSSVTDITIPYSVEEIGSGAFSYCTSLSNVQITSGGSLDRTIGSYTFFDCLALTNIDFGTSQVTEIGEASFAVDTAVTANMETFDAPDYITEETKLGEYLFGGRTGLKHVIMPSNFGYTSTQTVPDTLFYGCSGLECVEFPETCGMAKYNPDLFKEVTVDTFYVRGPKEDGHSGVAEPRKATWNAVFNTDKHVPYVYNDGGEDFYEVSNGDYVLLIDSSGVLTSCSFAGSDTDIPELKIPTMVGTTNVTGIKEGCFSGGVAPVLPRIQNLVIEDSAITNIGDNTFKGASKLETVSIGNSVTSIGSGAFSDCTALTDVYLGNGITSIGEGAFKDSNHLENIVFEPPIGGLESFPLENIGTDAFSTGGDKLTINGEIGTSYGPFIWAMQPDNYMNSSTGVRVCYKTPEPTSLTVILDNQNNLPTLIDYPHYEDLKDTGVYGDLIARYETDAPITPAEEKLIYHTLNLNVPEGIKSIDTKGYFNNDSREVEGVIPASNSSSVTAYFSSLPYKAQYAGYGLFNGFYGDETGLLGKREYIDGANEEKEDIGNDRIKNITLNTVEYLPDNCFKSCENLETINLGSSMIDVGKLPIEDCTALSSIASGNDNFVANNGILYQNLANGSKALIECFASRGIKVGTSTVSVGNDPDLADVSQIDPAAFKNCDMVTSVDFTGANGFDEIPDSCFENCDLLTEVDLPANVNTIGDKAFADTGSYTKVLVRGKEVSLGKGAFENVPQSYLVSYKDSGVRKAAGKQGVNIEQTLDDMFTVKFYTYDGTTLIKSVQVEEGKNAEAPEEDEIPEREGYTFTGWNRSLKNITDDIFVLAVYELTEETTPGVSPGNTPGVVPGITPGVASGTTPGATNNVSPTPKVSPTAEAKQYQLTVIYGSGSGKYASGTTVIINAIEPPAGKVFDKWIISGDGVTIASATTPATTVKTAGNDATITATYKNASSVSGNSTNRTSSSSKNNNSGNSNTRVDITKPGISNTDKAYATVKGSTDNFIIKITESDSAANEVATALSRKYSDMNPIKYFAMDITLYDATGANKIENTDNLSVNITMPVPDALVQYAGNNKVGAVVNGNLEDLSCKFTTIDGIPCVSFTATHFSPYTIFVDTSNLTQGTLDSTPKTGDGIHPKWFVVIAFASISLILFLKKDRVTKIKVA